MCKFPAVSPHIPFGSDIVASRGAPPSPVELAIPLPTTVDISKPTTKSSHTQPASHTAGQSV
eukprot:gene22257-28371_t